jgi:hypothetical protein
MLMASRRAVAAGRRTLGGRALARLLQDASLYLCSFQRNGLAIFSETSEVMFRNGCAVAQRLGRRCQLDSAELLAFIEAAAPRRRPLHWIFMTDWCGSTLLCRSLAENPAFFCYSEPEVFLRLALDRRQIDQLPLRRAIAHRALWRRYLKTACLLMSRTFRPQQRALIKESPTTNYLIEPLLGAHPRNRALFMYSRLEHYLASTLKSDVRRRYTRERVSAFVEIPRLPGLAALDEEGRGRLSDAQVAALHWIVQVRRFQAVAGLAEVPALRSLRQDEFLDDPAVALGESARFYGAEWEPARLRAVLDGHIFTRYSKDPWRPFAPGEWRRERDAALRRHRHEIRDGVAWAESVLGDAVPSSLSLPLYS